ncbi:MAG: T9SS type A sorting domain-containing protein [Bacteroidota bacterium]
MKKVPLLFAFSFVLALLLNPWSVQAQSGCPDCIIELPDDLGEDTIFLANVPAGERGIYYDQDISFRLPKTTNPVAATDPDVPANVNIQEITITRIANLPPGLSWEVNQRTFDPSDETDGCIKICGTPFISGQFEIEVIVNAKVTIFNREVTLGVDMEILPKSSSNDGFTILNSTGCGSTMASFTNNISSNGQPGFSYEWDFGNGNTSIDENPPAQSYSEPGVYVVTYRAIVDTTGYILTNIELISSSCDDLIGDPDIVFEIEDPDGEPIYESQEFTNTAPPIDVNVNIPLAEGNYLIKGTDKDSGLEFGDDDCVTTNFNRLSNDTLEGDNYRLKLTIVNPKDTIEYSDTVIVYELPLTPQTSTDGPTTFCQGDSVVLSTLSVGFYQWYLGDSVLQDAQFPELVVYGSGNYRVEVTSEEGCQVLSEDVMVTVNELPDSPRFTNERNELILEETVVLPTNYSLQWEYEGTILEGETSEVLCATQSGTHTLIVTDLDTGCSRRFGRSIVIDPDFDCTVGTADLAGGELRIFPNPVQNFVTIQSNTTDVLRLRLFDLMGRQLLFREYDNGAQDIQLDMTSYQSGIYLLLLESDGQQHTERLVKP